MVSLAVAVKYDISIEVTIVKMLWVFIPLAMVQTAVIELYSI